VLKGDVYLPNIPLVYATAIMASTLLNKTSQKNNTKMYYNKALYIVAKQLL